ncbi:PSMC3 interacting protein [Chamberlinius hualienensis]
MSKKSDLQLIEIVLDYMTSQNRPYSLVDIFTNLHGKYGKTALQKTLDVLVNQKKICEKSYGKQKVYVINQELLTAVSDVELKSMDTKILELNADLNDKTRSLKDAEMELNRLNSSLVTSEAQTLMDEIETELTSLNNRLKTLAENPNLVTAEDKKTITTNRDKYVKEWRKRRRCADDMLNAILEGYPKDKKALYEEIGVETDVDVGVQIPI